MRRTLASTRSSYDFSIRYYPETVERLPTDKSFEFGQGYQKPPIGKRGQDFGT